MPALLWVALVASALVAGATLVLGFVVPRPYESGFLIVTALLMLASVIAGNRLLGVYDSIAPVLAAALLALAGFFGGFALVSALLVYVRPRHRLMNLPASDDLKRTLVVMMADVEAVTYSVGDTTTEIEYLLSSGLPPPSLLMVPFYYAAQRTRYRAAGGVNPEWVSLFALIERLEPLLSQMGCAGPTFVSCSKQGELAHVLQMAEAADFRKVTVVGAHISPSLPCEMQRELAEEALGRSAAVSITFTSSLWSSDALVDLVARKALSVIRDPSVTGAALLVHGQPGDHTRANGAFDVDENSFANRVRTLLLEAGLTESRVRVCTAEWRDPGLTETVRHLGALGAEHIVVVPACYPFANLQTLLDIPVEIREARLADSVRVVQAPPWGDDPVFAEVLMDAIRTATVDGDAAV